MSYSFLLVSGIDNPKTVPVGAANNGQVATLRRKNSTLASSGSVANGKATFNIPAARVAEFAGSYSITVAGAVVQTGDIDLLISPSGGTGGGNVDLSNYPTKSELSSTVLGATSAKADKTYVDSQLSQKAASTDLSTVVTALNSKVNTTALNNYATLTDVSSSLSTKANVTDVNATLLTKANVLDVTNALASKVNAADVYPKTEVDSKIASVATSAPANAMVVVAHGGDANRARPTGASSVYWLGSAEPVNMTSYDLWNDGVTNPPAALTLNGAGGNASASFTINGGDGANAFALYQGTTATGTPKATSFPATVTGLTNGTAYSFLATATNSMGTVTSSVISVTPVSAAATLYDENFTTRTQTTSGGSVTGITDVNGVFYIGYFSNDEALSLYQPAISTAASTTNFGFATVQAPANTKFGSKIVVRQRSNNATALYPRAIVGATTNTATPDYYYSAFYPTAAGSTTGSWQIGRLVGGTATVLATSATIASISFPKEMELIFTPGTGLLELMLDGSNSAYLTATDSAPIAGRYAGVGFRTLASDTNASSLQAITRLTVKTY